MNKRKAKSFYITMWRWHFFAGLIIAPLLFLLTISGIIYLFTPQIEERLYADYYQVEAEGESIAPSEQIDSVLNHYADANITRYRPGEVEERSAEVHISLQDENLIVFVNPYNGSVIGEQPEHQRFSTIIKDLHGEFMLGTFGDRLVELAACWTLVLILTGMFMWLPKNKNTLFGVLIPRVRKGKKIVIRDLHVVPGFWISGGLVFLILTGLLWTGLWGTMAQNLATNSGVGYPPSVWVGSPPESNVKTKEVADVPWAAQNLPVPASDMNGYVPVSIDDVVRTANEMNIHPTYEVIYPSSKEGVYTLSAFPPKAEDEATIHIDQYTGQF
ncbi:PepSY domain-containing protein [Thalassobacillus sp. C254]|uniref:PepSY-associated TM helix domain-containing protein n=1 Tax=Thalassobacillus sp. C254 TaxID=1225341 RepID=UPI000AF97FE8|nr:PepSY domain-containing protein [Thalassobacillus sp. C254]